MSVSNVQATEYVCTLHIPVRYYKLSACSVCSVLSPTALGSHPQWIHLSSQLQPSLFRGFSCCCQLLDAGQVATQLKCQHLLKHPRQIFNQLHRHPLQIPVNISQRLLNLDAYSSHFFPPSLLPSPTMASVENSSCPPQKRALKESSHHYPLRRT